MAGHRLLLASRLDLMLSHLSPLGRGDGGEGMACVVYDLPPHPGPPTQSGGEGVYVVAALRR